MNARLAAQPARPQTLEPVAQLYVSDHDWQLCPLTHGKDAWLETLPAGTYDLVLATPEQAAPLPQGADALPDLPNPAGTLVIGGATVTQGYTAEQMHDYARAAMATPAGTE